MLAMFHLLLAVALVATPSRTPFQAGGMPSPRPVPTVHPHATPRPLHTRPTHTRPGRPRPQRLPTFTKSADLDGNPQVMIAGAFTATVVYHKDMTGHPQLLVDGSLGNGSATNVNGQIQLGGNVDFNHPWIRRAAAMLGVRWLPPLPKPTPRPRPHR